MTLITDPDSLVDPTSIAIDTSAKTIELIVAGALSTDGVTIKCVYSKLKELWKSNSTYIKFAFPMGPITDEQFEMINGWDWKNDTTRYLLRTGGWAVKDSLGVSLEEWAGIVSLGIIGSGDQAYFVQSAGGTATNFQLTGPVNQAVKVYGDLTHDNFDYRGYMKIYCRIYQKTYAYSQLDDIGVSALTTQAYRFPLANGADINVTHDDAAMTGAPYNGMSITWYAAPQERTIGSTTYNFHVIIDGNQGTAEEIYEFVQYKLRSAADIDADGVTSQIGKKVNALLYFVGSTLYTNKITEGGVFIDDYQSADINRLVFTDDLNAPLTFPYTAVLTLNFGDNLKNDTSAKYWVFFTNDDAGTNTGRDFGTSTAIIVNDATGVPVPMTDDVNGASSIQLTFAYDTNIQRGAGSAQTPAPITVVAIGADTSQYVKTTTTLTKSTANSASLVSALERNYSNPT